MRWKQFFTPVKSIDAVAARQYVQRMPGDAFTLLDVRQPGEYEAEHLPGAKLIPLPELGSRLPELDPDKPTVVYCAIGGRSRVAAQVLVGKGFREVLNLAGGIKAWNSRKAVGPEDLGLRLFSGDESPEAALLTAYALEEGLREFYLSMAVQVKAESARRLFDRLSAIEAKHQDRIFNEYCSVSGTAPTRVAFVEKAAAAGMEGGLTTDEYLRLYQPDLEVAEEVVSLAMAIEAQALDLYQRAADRSGSAQSRAVLLQIANEERAHLEQLGALFEKR